MRAVLYTPNLEPITVLQLKPWALEFLRERGTAVLAVVEPMPPVPLGPVDTDPMLSLRMRTVTIRAETLRRGRVESMLLITNDEESALLLESAFLPGQHQRVHELNEAAEGRGVMKGFLAAMDMLGRT